MDLSIQFAVNFMFQANIISDGSERSAESSHGIQIFPPAPATDLETGHRVLCEDEDICPDSTESSIYLMQRLQLPNSL